MTTKKAAVREYQQSEKCAVGDHEAEGVETFKTGHHEVQGSSLELSVCKHCRCVFKPKESAA